MEVQKFFAEFGHIANAPGAVLRLREMVKLLAVQGRLVPQDETEESAESFLSRLSIEPGFRTSRRQGAALVGSKIAARLPLGWSMVSLQTLVRIRSRKQELIRQGAIARKKPIKAEPLQTKIFPDHWEVLSLDEAISTIDAGWSPACLPTPRKDETAWGILKTTSVQTLRFLPQEHNELPSNLQPRPQYEVKSGDILITRAGPKNRVGICCFVDRAPPHLMISDKLIRFHVVDELMEAEFVALCLSAGESGRTLEQMKSGMADSQMNISQDKLRAITVPVPPYTEQVRIIKRVKVLLSMCDELEERLRNTADASDRLATAIVADLAGIDIEKTEEEALKAPQTELIAPVCLGHEPDAQAQAPLATILARHNGELAAKDLWQRFGGEIDAFYLQLKAEVARGWIKEPVVAELRETEVT